MGGAIAESLLTTVLEEAVKRIAKKVASGKRLSDSEVMILLLDQMNRRMEERFNTVDTRLNELRTYVDTRFNDLERNFNTRLDSLKDYVDGRLSEMSKRIDDLSKMVHALSIEVSSIKTDIIKLLKEKVS